MPEFDDRGRQCCLLYLTFLLLSAFLTSLANGNSIGLDCPSQVGGPVIASYHHTQHDDVHLILNLTFPCAANVSAWLCHKTDPLSPAFVGVWRPLQNTPNNNIFRLIGKNHIPDGYMGSHVFRIKSQYQIQAQPGDFIGYHYKLSPPEKNLLQTEILKDGSLVKERYKRQYKSHQHRKLSSQAWLTFQPNINMGQNAYNKDRVVALLDYWQGPTVGKTKTICTGDFVTLSCHQNELLSIRSAKYGLVTGHCGAPLFRPGGSSNPVTCFRPVWHVVHARCTGRTKCHFRVSEQLFGAPCPAQRLTLEVEFSCVNKDHKTTAGLGGLLHTARFKDQTLVEKKESVMMPSVYTIHSEETNKSAIVAGIIVTVAVVLGLLVAGIIVRRRIYSKRDEPVQSTQSSLINHHLRLDPAYLSARHFHGASHQGARHHGNQDNPNNPLEAFRRKFQADDMLGAVSTALDPGGSLDSSKARFNLQSYLEDSDMDKYSGVALSETLKSTMDFCNCNSRTLSGIEPDLEPLQDDLEEDKANMTMTNEYNASPIDDWDICVDFSLSTAKLFVDKDEDEEKEKEKEKRKKEKKEKKDKKSDGPPKPPRQRPYAIVKPGFLDSDSEGSSEASEDFSLKPKKFTIWSTTDDEDYLSDCEKKRQGY